MRAKAAVVAFVILLGGGIFYWVEWKREAPRRLSLEALNRLHAALTAPAGANLLEALAVPTAIQSRTPAEQIEFLTKALRDEISPEGIVELKKHGQFGPLKDISPAEASTWASQAGVNATNCVAFRLDRTNGPRAEVVLARSPPATPFRIVRCNNVKPLATAQAK